MIETGLVMIWRGEDHYIFVVYFLIIIWLGGCVYKFSMLIEKLKKWNPSLNT